ncbi:MAG: hypothetical protein FWH20_05830 [Oscillospiraceae bacterium]|nr:hypothetical protein [Oscillospiraceae bacterium]
MDKMTRNTIIYIGIIISIFSIFYYNLIAEICHEYGMSFSRRTEEGDGRINYNMLSSEYKKNISKKQYYSMDLMDLYMKINEISETVKRPEEPFGSTDYWKRGGQTLYYDNEFNLRQLWDNNGDGGYFVYHSADANWDMFIFPRVVYWYVEIDDLNFRQEVE